MPVRSIVFSTILSLFLIFFVESCTPPPLELPPNILYINVDDLGWKDLGAYGSEFYETPNIDALSQSGMLFTQAYAGAANCAPSRACLMSGQATPRHGMYTVWNSDRGESKDRKLIPTPNTVTLADSNLTLAEVLKDTGYVTATIGKWHLGEDPLTQGFDMNVAGGHTGGPKTYFSPYKNKNLEDGPEGEYLTDRLTDEAIRFMKSHQSEKFFLYVPFFAIHVPLMAKDSLKQKYEQKPKQVGQGHATYAAMIASVDENVGRILEALEELGLRENTLIIFTSDNGGICSVSSQSPLRAGKGSYYEGGIRVPLIASWSGKIKPETTNSTPVTNLDVFPTLLDVLNLPVPDGKILDGTSMLPIMTGKGEIAERPLIWHFPIYLQKYDGQKDEARDALFRTRPGSIIRLGDWKLHEYFEEGELELYNLNADLGERNNLIDQNPEKTAELLQILNDWRKEMDAPVPTELNPEFIAVEDR